MMEGHLQALKFFRRNFHSFYICVHQHAMNNTKICTMQKFPAIQYSEGFWFKVRIFCEFNPWHYWLSQLKDIVSYILHVHNTFLITTLLVLHAHNAFFITCTYTLYYSFSIHRDNCQYFFRHLQVATKFLVAGSDLWIPWQTMFASTRS